MRTIINFWQNLKSTTIVSFSLGKIKLPYPNLRGVHQISNVSCAIAAVRNLEDYPVNNEHIKKGITKIKSIARLQIID